MNHPFWKDLKFWERAIYDQVQEEIKNQKSEKLAKEIIFAKLCSMEFDMLSFDVSQEKVKDLMGIFAKSYKLTKEQVNDLMVALYF